MPVPYKTVPYEMNLIMIPLFFIFLTIFGLIHLPIFTFDYFYHDDILFWAKVPMTFSPHYMSGFMVASGRALGAGIITVAGWFINHVGDLQGLRILSALQLSLAMSIIFPLVNRLIKDRIQALCVLVMLITLPSYIIMVAWASNFLISLGLLGAVLAWWLCVKKHPLWGAVLLACALNIYPPSAMFFWVLVLLEIVIAVKDKISFNKLWPFFVSGFSALVIFAVILYATKSWGQRIITQGNLYNPYQFNFDFIGTCAWFVREPLNNALNLWSIFPKTGMSLCVGIFIITTGLWFCVHSFKQKESNRLWAVALIGACVFLSYLPNLVAEQHVAFYRSAVGLASSVLILFILCVYFWARFLPVRFRRITLTCCCIIGCIYGAYAGSRHALYDRLLPSINEYVYLKARLEQGLTARHQRVDIVRPNLDLKRVRYNEFGMTNAQYPADTFMMIYPIFLEMNKPLPNYIDSRWGGKEPDYYICKSKTVVLPTGIKQIQELGTEGRLTVARQNPNNQKMIGYVFNGQLYALLMKGHFPAENANDVLTIDMDL